MDITDGNDPGGSNCFKCKLNFDDVKAIIQCVSCKSFYHGKCENIELRGFHMKKATWKCKQCSGDAYCEEGTNLRSRKRSRVDEGVDLYLIEEMNLTLGLLLKTTNELNQKVDQLLSENQCLKSEIEKLKQSQVINADTVVSHSTTSTYASVTSTNKPNNTKILLVKQKNQQNDVTQIKRDLQDKVKPGELGIGVSMGRTTRDGGLILTCGNEKEITAVQSEIQQKLGDTYKVDRPKTREHRIKVVGVDEGEYQSTDDDIIKRVMKQNDLGGSNNSFKLQILRKMQVVNRRFNIIFETDSDTYNSLMIRQKMNLGWNRCWIYDDYGIVRCYNCNKYGHLQKECKDKKTCAKCAGEHDVKDCQGNPVKCINCVASNEKYKLNLKTNHIVWDHSECETYKRIEKSRKNKYIQ